MKHCCTCNEDLPVSDFNRSSRRKDGLQTECRKCQAGRHKTYYQDNKSRFREDSDAYRRKIRAFIAEAKSVPCSDCNNSYPSWVMDLDHLPGMDKLFNVGTATSKGFGLAKVQAEIAKCEVVCANCHRQRTHDRGEEIL
jgi:hypothetical protein